MSKNHIKAKIGGFCMFPRVKNTSNTCGIWMNMAAAASTAGAVVPSLGRSSGGSVAAAKGATP